MAADPAVSPPASTPGNRYEPPPEVDANDERWESGGERSHGEELQRKKQKKQKKNTLGPKSFEEIIFGNVFCQLVSATANST